MEPPFAYRLSRVLYRGDLLDLGIQRDVSCIQQLAYRVWVIFQRRALRLLRLQERIGAAALDCVTYLINRLLDPCGSLIEIIRSRLDVPLLERKLLAQPLLLEPLLRV